MRGHDRSTASNRVSAISTGITHIIPTHQGRAAERILFAIVGGAGKVIPNNSHFDTTRANVEYSGAEAVDLLRAEGKDPDVIAAFKGNMDVAALRQLIARVGAANIPLCMLTVTNNSGGGQPVSMENIRQVTSSLPAARHPAVPRRLPFRRKCILHQAPRARVRR